MGVIDKYIPEKTLALEYNSAKMIASPYDYKISERVLFYSSSDVIHKFAIFCKTYNTEEYLCEKLSLDTDEPYLLATPTTPITDITVEDAQPPVRVGASTSGICGEFVKYNNLIVDEDILLADLSQETSSKSYSPAINLIKSKSYLKALEVLFTKATGDSSLIPNLMYLATEFKSRSLSDLENIQFARDAMSKGIAPLIRSIDEYEYSEEKFAENRLLSRVLVPFYRSNDTGFISPTYEAKKDYILFDSNKDIGNDMYRMGLQYTVMYGAELLYYIDNITDITIRQALEDLLRINYKNDDFCSKYLYSFDSVDELEINPRIKACFCDNPELRFESIRTMFNAVIKDTDFTGDVILNMNYYALPIVFSKMICSMHAYAYQVARIKHATLLYSEAKARGLIDKDEFTEALDDDTDAGGGLFGDSSLASEEDDYNELIDLNTFTDSSDSASDEAFAEKEKMIRDKPKETPPMLNAADMLKKDLHNSPYDFDINYVNNSISYRNEYNNIATKINLITHELTRQIKEIKTYNTGGKQNGLLTGKLDKKNLWKYKTDPHIFYNNNYKLKEMDLAFGCILDESGSMGGEKIKNGRIVMIMLHEVLNSLGINHSIIGHTSHGMYQSVIYKYYQFKEENHYSLDKPYGLIRADNRSGNCDSGALFYMQSVMKAVKNKDKIVIIFSDGQPTECTDSDLTKQVKDMEKAGIHVIGVGINFSSIKEYYPDNANGKNLKEMVDIVVSILKRYVLEKKED